MINEYINNIKTNLEKVLDMPIYCTVHEDFSKEYITLEISTEEKSQLTENKIKDNIDLLKQYEDMYVDVDILLNNDPEYKRIMIEFDDDYLYITKPNKEEYWTKEEALKDQLKIIDNILTGE